MLETTCIYQTMQLILADVRHFLEENGQARLGYEMDVIIGGYLEAHHENYGITSEVIKTVIKENYERQKRTQEEKQ